MSKLNKIPEFKTEAEEREFWETHDSSDYLDWGQAKPASFPKLKPSTKTISLRLPEALLDRIKILWARSSPSAFKAGIYYKTFGRPPIPVPPKSLASGSFSEADRRVPVAVSEGVWHTDPCEEMIIFSYCYDFNISIIQF